MGHAAWRPLIALTSLWIWSRADSRFVPNQWETVLFCNDVSHWLGANLESVLWSYPSSSLLCWCPGKVRRLESVHHIRNQNQWRYASGDAESLPRMWRFKSKWDLHRQSGWSPKVVALFFATNFSSNILELLQLHDTIQIKWNYA